MIGSKLTLTARGLVALGVTSFVMLIAFAGLSWFGSVHYGQRGIAAAAVACGLAWFGGVTAVCTITLFHSRQHAVPGLLLATLVRMSPPLAAGLILLMTRSELLQAGVIGMLIGVYLLGLFTETALSWWVVEASSGVAADGVVKAS